jgi:ABC-type bacteriocin/lantibiotic exporter with double-glycine peptidase domain
MEFIEQRTKTDCGVACVAMLSNHLYMEIIGLFPGLKRNKKGLTPGSLLDVLEDLQYTYQEIKTLPNFGRALVAIRWKNKDFSGHFVTWDGKRKQFLDPLHGAINKKEFLKKVIIDNIWKIYRSR